MRNNRGTVLLQYILCIPIIMIISASLYMIFSSVVDTNESLMGNTTFATNQAFLNANILNDLCEGKNQIQYIEGDSQRGFILNEQIYDFSNNEKINFSKLNISVEILEESFIVTTKLGAKEYNTRYNLEFWGGSYE